MWFLLLIFGAVPAFAVTITFDYESGITGFDTFDARQTLSGETLKAISVHDVLAGQGTSGGTPIAGSESLFSSANYNDETSVTFSLVSGKQFDLTSMLFGDYKNVGENITLTSSKGSLTYSVSASGTGTFNVSGDPNASRMQGITSFTVTASPSNFWLIFDTIVLQNITAPGPTVTDAKISISGASGTGGAYKIGDTVTATWNNTAGGDNNSGITGVTVNFSQFGGGSAVAATNSSGTWTATYTLVSGAVDTSSRNVSVSVTNSGGTTTQSDSTNATVDNIAPTITDARISISGASGTGGAYKIGDTITATWNNTAGGDNNSDTTSSVTVDFSQFGGGSAVAASNSSGTWTATYSIVSGAIDGTSKNVSVTATDNAGNTATTADTTNATLDNVAPTVTDANISISGASGTGGAFKIGDTVTATWNNTAGGDNNSDTISSVTVNFSQFGGGSAVAASNSSGTWTATYSIVSGAIDGTSKNVSVTATDNSGNTTTRADTTNATLDNIAPTVTDANISSSGASGTGGAYKIGDTVTATWNNTAGGDNNSDTISSVTVDFSQFGGSSAVTASNSSGTWTATYTLVSGSVDLTNRNVSITATDNAGDTTTRADTTNASVDSAAPTVSDANISISGASGTGGAYKIGDTVTATWNNTAGGDNNSDTISGVTVDFSQFGGSSAVTASNSSGTWTATYTVVSGAINGTTNRNVSVTATDNAGNTTTTADTTNVTVDNVAPTITFSSLAFSADNGSSSSDFITSTAAQTISATLSGAPGGSDIVYGSINNGSSWTNITGMVSGTSLSWTGVTLTASNTLKLKITDAAGNDGTVASQAYALDTSAPSAPSTPDMTSGTDTGSSNTDNITSTTTPTFTGTAESASTVRLYDTDGTTVLGTATATGGNWSITSSTLSQGSHTLTAASTDTAGNVSSASSGLSAIIDTTSPSAPVLTAISNDTGASATDQITTDTTLVLSGTAEANSTVDVYRNAVLISSTPTNGSGAWSFDYTGTTLGAGTHTFTAIATDAAGNASSTSAAFLVEIDTTTPTAPVITAISNDTGTSGTDGITSDRTLIFSGTAEANAVVTISRNSIGVIGTATANGSGAWSFDYTGTSLADGSYIFTAFAADTAGNASAVSADFPVTIDGTAPGISPQPAGGTYVAGDNFVLTVGATDNTTVTYQWYLGGSALTNNSNRTGATTASVTHTAIGTVGFAGDYTVVVTDAAGNTTTSNAATIVVNKADQTITFPAIADKTTTSSSFAISAVASTSFAVTFSVVSGPATLSGSTVTITGAGTVTIRATQAGDLNYNSATADRSFTVTKTTATVALASLSYTYDGAAHSATATTSPSGLTAGLTYDGSSTPPTNAGSYAVVATISDATYQGTGSGTLVIGSAAQAITFTALSDKTFGDAAFALSGSASSGLPVSFSIVSGPASISGSTITLTGASTVVVRASQAGNSNFNAATSVDRGFTVGKATATVTLGGLSATYDGSAHAATATTSPSGLTVNLAYAGSSTPPTNAGSYSVVATMSDTNYTGTTSGTLTIAKASQTIAFPAIASIGVGSSTTLSASASSGLPVTFSLISGDATIAGSTLAITSGDSAVVVRASQAGNSNYEAATSVDRNVSSSKLSQTITFAALADKLASDAAFTLSASSSSGLPVTFSVTSGGAMLSGSSLTLTAVPGIVTVRATQAGNSTYAAATAVERSFNVSPVGPQIYFGRTASGDRVAGNVVEDGSRGTIIGYLGGTKEGFVVNFTLDESGKFTATATTYAANQIGASSEENSTSKKRVVGVREVGAATTGTRTFKGLVADGVLAGTITELGLSFSAVLEKPTGATANIAGYYVATSTKTSAGGTYVVVGTQGEAYVLAVTSDVIVSGDSAMNSDGSFQVSSGSTTVGGAINANDTTVTGTISHSGGTKETFAGTASTTARTDRLINLSSRAMIAPGDMNNLVTGFVIGGSSPKQLLLRAIGPSLANFGITNALADPKLRVYNAAGQVILENDDWSGADVAAASARVGAFALTAQSKDATVLTSLAPGAYTMHVIDGGGSGVALVEIYDASTNPQAEYQRLINISSRGNVAAGEGVLVGGFVVTGNTPKRVLIRGIGPALTPFGVNGALSNPLLKLYDSTGTVIAQNDDWGTPTIAQASQTAATAAEVATTAQKTGAFALPTGSKDAAIVVTLAPGLYSAQVSGVSGATGVALIEVYEVIE